MKSAKNSEYDVMCINPGGMNTELWAEYKDVKTEDFLNPNAVAEICISLISFPQRVFIESCSIIPPSDI
jgi:NADP-dependent 3-hydroxy acid dehydrogenase YdfG